MRISDWSSDVCSSDLHQRPPRRQSLAVPARPRRTQGVRTRMKPMMTARTCHFAASARPRIDYRRRLSLAGLAVACVLLAGCSLLGGGGTRERGTIYAPDPRIDADQIGRAHV